MPACEIMLNNSAVRSSIREGKIHQLYSSIQLGQKEGMRTLNQALASLVEKGIVSAEEAMLKSSNAGRLEKMIEQLQSGQQAVVKTARPTQTTKELA